VIINRQFSPRELTMQQTTKPPSLWTIFCFIFLWSGCSLAFGAVDFDGTDDYINAGTSNTLNFSTTTSTFSITAWIYPTAYNFTRCSVLAKWLGTGNQRQYFFGVNSSNGVSLSLSPDGTAASAIIIASTGADISLNSWYHIAATLDVGADSYLLYVNGSEVATSGSTAIANLFNSSGSVNIGSTKDGTDDLFDGQIDDVRIYNRVLSASEIEVIAKGRLKYDALISNGNPVVTFDAATNGGDLSNATSGSWSHATNTGTNRYLVVGLAGWDGVDSLTNVAITYNGVAMTKLGGEQTAAFNNAILWGLANPASGSNTVSISNIPSGYAELSGGSVSFTNVHQTSSTGTLVSELDGDASVDIASLTVLDLGVDILYSGVGMTEPVIGAGGSKRVNANLASNSAKWMMMGTEGGAGTVTMSWTDADGSDFGQAAVPLKSAGGLVGYWPLDDSPDGTSGDGDTFVDRSGTGNNGTGVDGANNTGLTVKASSYLMYPAPVQ